MLQHASRDHFCRGIIAEQKYRELCISAALRAQNLIENVPSLFRVLDAIDRDQPAGFTVEHMHETASILVRYAADDPEAFVLDGLCKLAHSKAGCPAAFIVLVDDGNGK